METKPDLGMHSDTQLVNVINGAIRMQIQAHGNVTPNQKGIHMKLVFVRFAFMFCACMSLLNIINMAINRGELI